MANIKASRALAFATAMAFSCEDALSKMLESVSKPTAMIVNKIIKVSVLTKANPGRQMFERLLTRSMALVPIENEGWISM